MPILPKGSSEGKRPQCPHRNLGTEKRAVIHHPTRQGNGLQVHCHRLSETPRRAKKVKGNPTNASARYVTGIPVMCCAGTHSKCTFPL